MYQLNAGRYVILHTLAMAYATQTKTRAEKFSARAKHMMPPNGLEPMTRGFSVHCSTN